MKVELIEYKKVEKDGRVPTGGAVTIKPMVQMSTGEGCGLGNCHCSDGYWITIGAGRDTNGTVKVMVVYFDNKKEYNRFMKSHRLTG